MNETQFVYWLQGYLELADEAHKGMSERQVEIIRDHLALVLKKTTPRRPVPPKSDEPYTPAESFAIEELQEAVEEALDGKICSGGACSIQGPEKPSPEELVRRVKEDADKGSKALQDSLRRMRTVPGKLC